MSPCRPQAREPLWVSRALMGLWLLVSALHLAFPLLLPPGTWSGDWKSFGNGLFLGISLCTLVSLWAEYRRGKEPE